jgi:diacylglycerol kinase (ATP)
MNKFFKSFRYAFNGVFYTIKTQTNAKVHLFIGSLVICLSLYLKIEVWEWLVLSLVIGLVLATEIMNTAIESLADAVSTEQNTQIGIAKDCAAGAVLIVAIAAVFIGTLIFVPKLLPLF